MKIRKPLKIIGIVVLSILVLFGLLNFGINFLIKSQVPKIIVEKNDTPYDFTYSAIEFSIFRNSLSIKNVKIKAKEPQEINKNINLFGSIKEINVYGVNFYELIKKKNLKAFTISIIGPDLTIFKQASKDSIKQKSQVFASIDIDRIQVAQANVKVLNHLGDTLLHKIYNFNTTINGVHMGAYTVKKDIPFTYTNYTFKIDSLYSMINDLQIAKSGAVDIDNENISIQNFQIKPSVSSNDFQNSQTNSQTRLFVDVPKLELKQTDWGYDKSELFVNIATIDMDSIEVKILDQKKETHLSKSQSKANSLIPFKLKVDELNIKNSSFNSLQTFDIQNVNIKVKNIVNEVNDRLTIDQFQLNNPIITQSPTGKIKEKQRSNNKLNDHIQINQLMINNASYTLLDSKNGAKKLTVLDFKLNLDHVQVNDKTVLENIPFLYDKVSISTGKIHFNIGKDYNIYAAAIATNGKNAVLQNFQMTPKMSHSQYLKTLKYAHDHYNISSKTIQVNNFNWGFDQENDFYIKIKEIVLDQMKAEIHRDISVPLNPQENHLYGYKLRNLKLPFEIQSLKIRNSNLSYEETNSNNKLDAGKLSFTRFNLTANNLYSGYKRTKGAATHILVNTKFMNQGDLVASWQFSILDKVQAFNINGTLKNFPAAAMDPFLKPYMNVKARGEIDHMAFNFSGNNEIANGQYAMDYKDLIMTIFNSDKKEQKLLSKAVNTVMTNDTNGLKKVEIKPVERKKDRSFFNFLWLCIMQGLKQTVI